MNKIQLTGKVDVPDDNGSTTQDIILTETVNFNEWDINSLIDLIIKPYHFKTKKDIVIIYDLAQNVFVNHRKKHPEIVKLVEALFLFFDDLSFHLKKEEQILFPNIIQLTEKKTHVESMNYTTFGMIKELALIMQQEHQAVIKQLDFFRRITNNYLIPKDGSIAYKDLIERMKRFEKNLLEHIALENSILFPNAIRMDEKYLEKGQK